jgi:pimeloyl-ACP methyl ester carboxylesterase
VQDAISAVAVVRREPSVDPSRIFIIGHGLGGLVAGEIASRAGNIAGLVLVAVPARPLLYVTLEELRDHAPPTEVIDRAAAQAKAVLDGSAFPAMRVLGEPAAFWYDLAKRDPFETVRQVARPVLLIRGETDAYATEMDHQRWVRELGGLKVRAETIPLTDHALVSAAPVGRPGAAPQQEPQVAQYLIDLVADFVTKSPAVGAGNPRRR